MKYCLSESAFKTQVLTFQGGSAEESPSFFMSLNTERINQGIQSVYQKLESGLEQLFQGTGKDDWSPNKGAIQLGTDSGQSFTAHIDDFRSIYTPEPAVIKNKKTYLQRVRKINKLSIPLFLS